MGKSVESDAALIARAQAGEEAALAELLTRYERQIYSFGLRFCHHPEDAEEILQDTLLALATQIKSFRGEAALSTWLYRVARNACTRRRRREPEVAHLSWEGDGDALAETPHPGPMPDDRVAQQQLGEILTRTIQALPPLDRDVVILRDVEGLRAAEVAEILELSVGAVKSRLHRARKVLRDEIGQRLDGPRSADCPDIVSLFSQHLEGDLSATMCEEMERHMEACAACAADCDGIRSTLAACQTLGRDGEVPPEVQARIREGLAEWIKLKI